MSVISEFAVPADAFALGQTFEEAPDVTIEIERLATHSREWVMPFLWATGDDLDAFESAMDGDPTVSDVQTIDKTSGVGLYNVQWSEDVMELIDMIVDQNGIVIEGEASQGTWYLKLRFLDRQLLEEFQTYFDEHSHSFDLLRLHEETEPKQREFDLTPAQREVLLVALETGYFEVPRATKITELAERLGISSNAASQRLRRATTSLVEATLTVSSPGDEPET
jgi:predicted DNA binding protein